ncbi:MAG: F0F1 ATP synthase subunit B [Bacteroidia bacterium]|nr:F0F1 ATP synthase subunit B [Bacteroidia bacterium]
MELVTPGIGLVFWMLVSFGILLFLLKKFAWKPVLDMLKERESSIEKALQSAERAKEEMARLQADNEKIINEAKFERDKLIKEARETKEQLIGEAKTEAQKEAQKLMENARQTIEQEKFAAVKEIKNQVATLSVGIAEKILRKELATENKQKDFIDGLLKDVKLN